METHILFFILAGLLIAVLVGASVWSARREKSRVFSNTFSTRPPATPINQEPSNVPPVFAENNVQMPQTHDISPEFAQVQQQEIEERVNEIKISLPGQEPVVQQSQPYSEPAPQVRVEIAPEPVQPEQPVAEQTNAEPQIITLYVVAAEGQQFSGEMVVQGLEAVGLQFGEYNIFHRHVNNDITNPVQFSVANMMQPGVFDLNNLENFATVGLVFFMHLPSAVGSDLSNLKLMISTIDGFAKSVGGFVLNDQHQLFDDVSRQEYLLRVRQA